MIDKDTESVCDLNHTIKKNWEVNDLKEIRKQTKMTQRQFAEHFGIPLRTLQNWENGVNTPPEYTVNMIRRLLRYEELLSEHLGEENS